jgi:hypothetical protein
MITRREMRLAEAVANRLPPLLQRRGLKAPFRGFYLTEVSGLRLLIADMDTSQVNFLERYTSGDLVNHLRVETGLPVYLAQNNGLRYVLLLSPPPRLPRKIELPADAPAHQVTLGMRVDGTLAQLGWGQMGHVLAAGMTGSGKSAFLRLLVWQALRDGLRLLLSDLDGATFPMLADHPALLQPIASAPVEALELIGRALGECDHRAALFKQSEGFPENIAEYNAHAVKAGKQPLPRVLVVLDEFSATAAAEPQIKALIAALGWRGRKFGLNVVFAAQEFTKELVGPLREQVSLAVCFRVRSAELARRVGCEGAERISPNRPGLALTDRWGPLQTCFVDKSLFEANAVRKAALTEEERLIAVRAAAGGGHISIPLLTVWGWSEWKARRLLESWERRGWLVRDGVNRRISPKLRELVSNPQPPQSASNPSNRLKSLITECSGDADVPAGEKL